MHALAASSFKISNAMKSLIGLLIFVSLAKASICQATFQNEKTSTGLSNSEAGFLDSMLLNKRGDFEFKEKNVVFVTGSSANKIITKAEFFEAFDTKSIDQVQLPLEMLVLSAEEKRKANGYDVIIISWSKVVITDRQKNKILKQLGQKSKSARS